MKTYKKKIRKAIKKRYTTKTGGAKVRQMAKDVMYLKSVLNPEKKRQSQNSLADGGNLVVGQVLGNADGAFSMVALPTISTGTGIAARTGSSVKLHSSIWQFNFNQMSSGTNPIKLILEFWMITDKPYDTSSEFFLEKYDVNPFIGTPFVRDYNALYDPDNYMKGKCIAKRIITVPGDDLSGQSRQTNLLVPIKYNRGQGHHLRYAGSSDTLSAGQIILTIRANRGNASTAIVSTMTGIMDGAINTGINLQYNAIHYYYDN